MKRISAFGRGQPAFKWPKLPALKNTTYQKKKKKNTTTIWADFTDSSGEIEEKNTSQNKNQKKAAIENWQNQNKSKTKNGDAEKWKELAEL